MNERQLAADLAKKLYRNEITIEDFFKKFPDSEDEEIANLLDLIEHEPQKGGIFGVKSKEHDEYLNKIQQLINRLSNSAHTGPRPKGTR